MRLIGIQPKIMSGVTGDAIEPAAFALLAALTPPGVEFVFQDERMESLNLEASADLVALSSDTFGARRAYQIAQHFRRRGIPVVMGGQHPTLAPEEALRFASAVVRGDAEVIWPQLLEDARTGRLQPIYENRTPPLAGVCPDRSIFRKYRYKPLRIVQFGRGCPHACDFCSVHAFYGASIRHRPVAEVLAEMETCRGQHILFADDHLFAKPAATQELLEKMKPLKLRWSCQVGLDTAAKPALVRQMADAGCVSATVGFESLDDNNLAQMAKRWNKTTDSYREAAQILHDHGIMIYGTFLFGYDHDTLDSFARTVEFAISTKLCLANFCSLMPTPGTPLYDRLKQEGRLLYDPWWLHPEHRHGKIPFRPAQMTAEQLTEGCFWARREFNRFSSIGRRALNLQANLRNGYHAALYLGANLVNRRAIYRKQGQPLGDPAAPDPYLEIARS